MSRTVPRTDPVSRLNQHQKRLAQLERQRPSTTKDAYAPTMTTSSGTFVADPNSPTVCAQIGTSGDALVTVSSTISVLTTTDYGHLGVSVDGGTAVLVATHGAFIGTTSATIALSDLGTDPGPGAHTVVVEIASGTGAAVGFSGTSLIVQPL